MNIQIIPSAFGITSYLSKLILFVWLIDWLHSPGKWSESVDKKKPKDNNVDLGTIISCTHGGKGAAELLTGEGLENTF